MPGETFADGSVLTAAQLNLIMGLLPWPTPVSVSTACVAGNMYLVTTGTNAIFADLPSPAALGQVITIRKVDTAVGTVNINTPSGLINGVLDSVPYSSSSIVVSLVNEGMTVVSDGTNWQILSGFKRKPLASAYASASQSIAVGTNLINLSVVTFDNFSGFNLTAGINQYTIPVSGIYRVSGQVKCGTTGTGPSCMMYVNGAMYSYLGQVSTVAEYNAPSGSRLAVLTAGWTVQLVMGSGTASQTQVDGGNADNYLDIEWVAA